MTEMAKTDEGVARLARMNERVDRYVAERVEEGDQHAPQGGIVGNVSHVVPIPDIAPSSFADADIPPFTVPDATSRTVYSSQRRRH